MWLLWALRLGTILVPIVPARLGYAICRGVGLLAYLTSYRARRQVLGNLEHSAPYASRLRRHRAAIGVFTTAATNYFDLLRLRAADDDELREFMDIRGERHLDQAVAAGKGVIVVSAHLGNFNVVARYPAIRGWPTAIVAEQVRPPGLDDLLTRLRSTAGLEIISTGPGAVRSILSLLHRKGVVLLAADRDIGGHSHPVSFFGAPANLPAGPVILAMHTGAPLLPAFTIRRSPWKSDVYIDRPIDLVKTGDFDADLQSNLRLMAAALERMIATDPAQWAVLQAVWKPTGTPPGRQRERRGSVPDALNRYLSRQT